MKKYNLNTIQDYISGKEITEYSIEELENDIEFMTAVIRITNDSKLYNLCSDELKTNYQFVKFLIERFPCNEEFISQVADTYLSSNPEKINRMELLIIMSNLIINKELESYMRYRLLLMIEYSSEKIDVAKIKLSSEDNPTMQEALGESGFLAIYDEYNKSSIVTDYFAGKLVQEILKLDYGFEDFLHIRFASRDDLEKTNMRSYLINYISAYDTMLSSYISSHIHLLTPALAEVEKVKMKWNRYQKTIELKRMNLLFEYVQQYMEQAQDCSYSEDAMLYFIAKELGIEEIIIKYDRSMDINDDIYNIVEGYVSRMNINNMSINDLRHYYNLKSIILRFMNSKSLFDLDKINSSEEPNNNGVIINFPKKI